MIDHNFGRLDRLRRFAMQFARNDQAGLLQQRNIHGRKQLGVNLRLNLDGLRLGPERRHGNNFSDVILGQREPLWHQDRDINNDEE